MESFISLCNVKITIEMTEILELEKHGYKTRLQNNSFSVNSCLDYPVNLVVLKIFLQISHPKIYRESESILFPSIQSYVLPGLTDNAY